MEKPIGFPLVSHWFPIDPPMDFAHQNLPDLALALAARAAAPGAGGGHQDPTGLAELVELPRGAPFFVCFFGRMDMNGLESMMDFYVFFFF